VQNGGGKLRSVATNFPLEVFYLRDDDIPQYVEEGVADCGIAGQNVILEKGKTVTEEQCLGFGRCRLSLAVPKGKEYRGIGDFQGRNIATSYPVILRDFLTKNGVDAGIRQISGSVEIAPGIGLADGICDIVSSGSTLLSNGLREVAVVMKSEAVLIASPTLGTGKKALLEQLLFRIRALNAARRNKYILLNAPNEKIPDIARILPGMKSPTVMPLQEPGWSSVHTVVQEDRFWEIIEDLKACGAQGILVAPIEKMIL
jgi:ATP phosphoribosyltransferase